MKTEYIRERFNLRKALAEIALDTESDIIYCQACKALGEYPEMSYDEWFKELHKIAGRDYN